MKTIKSILLLTAVLLGSSFSYAAQHKSKGARQTSPDALVAALYKQHAGRQSPFYQTKNRSLLDRYFEKEFAALLWKEATGTVGEVGVMDADPLYDAQDTDIKKFVVHRPRRVNGREKVSVSFENFGQKEVITFTVGMGKTGWKIEDIKYRDGRSLRNTLRRAAEKRIESASAERFFGGRYRVGDTFCTVKPIKMAFEVGWAKETGTMMYFFDRRTPEGKFIYASEDKGAGADRFVFDDDRFDSGNFIRADGTIFPLKKIK